MGTEAEEREGLDQISKHGSIIKVSIVTIVEEYRFVSNGSDQS